ncbi:hypothetical protein [Lysinibacillus pakistanensis]|uniref:hypothetical protein n=1 Tax=Lysinibacillus pakistanensis TaxID=759811 RepID=UPI0034E3D394
MMKKVQYITGNGGARRRNGYYTFYGIVNWYDKSQLKSKPSWAVLKELRLFDESYQYQKNETTVEKNTIRYNLKYDQSVGVIFSISKVN